MIAPHWLHLWLVYLGQTNNTHEPAHAALLMRVTVSVEIQHTYLQMRGKVYGNNFCGICFHLSVWSHESRKSD